MTPPAWKFQLAQTRDAASELPSLRQALQKATADSEKLKRQLAEVVTLQDEEAVRPTRCAPKPASITSFRMLGCDQVLRRADGIAPVRASRLQTRKTSERRAEGFNPPIPVCSGRRRPAA